jgi:nitroreductase
MANEIGRSDRKEKIAQVVQKNIYLQCESLGLATVAMGAFHDDEVAKVLCLLNEV